MADVTIDINARTSQARREVAKLGESFGGLSKTAVNVAAAAAAAVGAAVVSSVNATRKLGDELQKLSIRTGETVEDLSRLKLVAELSDVSFDRLGQTAANFARRAGEALRSPTSAAAQAFDRLGIELEGADGKLITFQDALIQTARSMEGMEDPTRRLQVALDVFGRSGAELLPVLDAGAEGIREMMEEADELGAVMSTGTAQDAARLNDALTKLSAAAVGFGRTFGEFVIPTLADVAEGALEAARAIGILQGSQRDNIRATSQAAIQKQAEAVSELSAQLEVASRSIEAEVANLERLREAQKGTADTTTGLGRAFSRYQSGLAESQSEEELEARIASLRGEQARLSDEYDRARTTFQKLKAELGGDAGLGVPRGGDREPFTPSPSRAGRGRSAASTVDRARDAVDEYAAAWDAAQKALADFDGLASKIEGRRLSEADQLVAAYERHRQALEDQLLDSVAQEGIGADQKTELIKRAADARLALEQDLHAQLEELRTQEREQSREDHAETLAQIQEESEAREQAAQGRMEFGRAVADTLQGLESLVTAVAIQEGDARTAEQKKAAKAGFAAQQAFAVGSALVNTALAITNALATVQPYPAAIAASIAAGVQGFAQVAAITATSIQGVADAGLMPGALKAAGLNQHTVLAVRNDESVVDPRGTSALSDMLELSRDRMARDIAGRGGGPQNITLELDGQVLGSITRGYRIADAERGLGYEREVR